MPDDRTSGMTPPAPPYPALTPATVITALGRCYDPCCRDRQISVVDMGLIDQITIEGGAVRIRMLLTSGWCPFAARLFEMIEQEVAALPGVAAVDVAVDWTPTWTPARMSPAARDKLRLPLEQLIPLREARLKGERQ